MNKILNNGFFSLLFFIFFTIYFLISLPYYSGDVINYIVWGESILKQSPIGFYDRYFHDFSFPNYPPISMLLFAFCVWLYDLVFRAVHYLNNVLPIFPSFLVPLIEWENTKISFLKLPAIIPSIGIAVWFYLILNQLKKELSRKTKLFHIVLFLINPAIIYLAAIWGQNDLQQNLFILFAFYFLLRKKLWVSAVFGALAILSKQTILVIWAIYMLTFLKLYKFKKTFIGGLITLVVLYLFYLPFNNHGLLWPFEFYIKTLSVSTGFLVSDNAINLWGTLFNFQPVDAAQTVFLFSWERWGFMLFLISFLPLAYIFWKKQFNIERLFQFLFVTSLCYFFVLTRMHERYLIPAVIFSAVLAVINKRYWLNYLFFSMLFFINLYKGLYQPDIPLLTILVKNNIFLNLLVIIYALFLVYNYYLFLKDSD